MLQNLRNEYAKAISRWQVKNPDLDYLSIWKSYNPNTWTEELLNGLSIEHTLWCCDNSKCKKGGILITGINPSFNKYFYSPDATFFETANTNGSDYWSTKKNMVDIFRGEVAYLDLFPIRMTSQKDFMKDNIIPISLKVALLEVTISAIEELAPRLIINPNKGSSVYWGLNKNKPWMGYNMIEQDNPIGKQTHLYKITGIIDDPHVVNPQRKSVLNYTLFLLAKYHGNGVLKAEDYLKSSDIAKIYL